MHCKAWWKKAAGQTSKWWLLISEEGNEIRGQPPPAKATAAREVRGPEMEVTIYYLHSTLLLDILKPLTLATYYEKNCFVLNHGLNRHCVCRFLRGKIGNNRDFDHRGNGPSFAVAYTA